jgi:hypothetical protein
LCAEEELRDARVTPCFGESPRCHITRELEPEPRRVAETERRARPLIAELHARNDAGA